MSGTNKKTLEAYERNIQKYVDGTEHEMSGSFKDWLDRILGYLPEGGTVLEIGSAFGRDAEYIQKMGFEVKLTDATQGFVDLLKEKGHRAEKLNIITDDVEGQYDLIFANAVFLHFNPDELRLVLSKVKQALKQDGVLAFSVKEGQGSGWSDKKLEEPRFFQYWEVEPLKELLEENGFDVLEIEKGKGQKDTNWIHVIAK